MQMNLSSSQLENYVLITKAAELLNTLGHKCKSWYVEGSGPGVMVGYYGYPDDWQYTIEVFTPEKQRSFANPRTLARMKPLNFKEFKKLTITSCEVFWESFWHKPPIPWFKLVKYNQDSEFLKLFNESEYIGKLSVELKVEYKKCHLYKELYQQVLLLNTILNRYYNQNIHFVFPAFSHDYPQE